MGQDKERVISFSKPAPDLARKVAYCWWTTGCRRGRKYHEVLPDGNASVVFRFSPAGCRMVLHGPRTETVSIEIDEEADYLCFSFLPGEMPRLVDATPASLVNTFADLFKLGGERVDSLADRFLPMSPAARQKVMESLLRDTAPLVRDHRCRHAARLLSAHRGVLHVNDLANSLGLHLRSLERIYRTHLGISPKQHARLVRLGHMIFLLRSHDFQNLADLAYACGYTDQSHMNRDFKDLTGMLPPKRWLDLRPVEGAPQTSIVHLYRGEG